MTVMETVCSSLSTCNIYFGIFETVSTPEWTSFGVYWWKSCIHKTNFTCQVKRDWTQVQTQS